MLELWGGEREDKCSHRLGEYVHVLQDPGDMHLLYVITILVSPHIQAFCLEIESPTCIYLKLSIRVKVILCKRERERGAYQMPDSGAILGLRESSLSWAVGGDQTSRVVPGCLEKREGIIL